MHYSTLDEWWWPAPAVVVQMGVGRVAVVEMGVERVVAVVGDGHAACADDAGGAGGADGADGAGGGCAGGGRDFPCRRSRRGFTDRLRGVLWKEP